MNAKACKKGQMIIGGKCSTQTKTLYKKLPALHGKHPVTKLMNFYADLGWDGKQNLKPGNVVVNEADWLKMIEEMTPKDVFSTEDDRMAAKWMFTNKGPSGSNKVKRGKVKLVKGWV